MLARQAISGNLGTDPGNLGTGPENPWKIRKIPVIGSHSGTGAKPLYCQAIGTRQSGAEPQLMPSLGSLWSLMSLQRRSKQKKSRIPRAKRVREADALAGVRRSRRAIFLQKKLPATSYSRTGESRTTLGDGALNFCVRNGNRCDNPSMVTGKKPFE